jgi:hypothetical protein
MDEASRRLERESQASGDGFARARAANEHLRSGRFEAALAALGEPTVEASSGLEVTTRALAHARLGLAEAAVADLEAALVGSGSLDVEPAALLEVLAPALEGKVPLGRARAARLLARVPARPDLDLGSLRHDPDPLVRIALVTDRPSFTKDERVSRVYGSHGADYETGRFIAFDAPLEMRLRTFELPLFKALAALLATLSRDPPLIEAVELRPAFGDGWGLGGNTKETDKDGLLAAIERLNALDLLPWKVRHCDVRPYDLMEDEDRFVRRLARDVGGHPVGRQAPFDPSAPLLARFLAKHPMRGGPCPWSELEPLLDEARRVFSPLGLRACEHFARVARGKLPG